MPKEPSSWTDLISDSVYTSDDQDIGDIEAVSRNFIVVKKGLVKEVKTNYERDAAPDPYNYHYSSAPTVDPANVVRRFQINMPKIPPRAQEDRPFLVSQGSTRQEDQVLLCNLCNVSFRTDDELSTHVESSH